jgi:hypothetical protein
LITNFIVILLFVILPEFLSRYSINVFFNGRVQLFRDVVNYFSFIIMLLAGVYLFRYNFLFIKNNPKENKFVPAFFLVVSVVPVLYSLLLLYVFLALRNGFSI